jgi:hypothetical protein
MRRPHYLAFFLCLIACGLFLHWRSGKQEPNQSSETPVVGTPPVALPRIASAVPSRAAPGPLSSIPSRDAGNDTDAVILDEQSLMQQIRAALTKNPRLAETLARQGQQRFSDSPSSDERDMLLVAALFNQGRLGRARFEAYSYFEQHPGGRYAKDLSVLTGAHPLPSRQSR